MQVRDVMTKGAECVRPADSLQQAAQKMRVLDVGPLPVCGDQDRLVGMITDRDIAVRAVAEACDPRTTAVQDVMTPDVVYCYEDQDVQQAARLMQEHQVRRLVVLNRDKRLVGIVSLGDLAVGTGDEKLAGKTLEEVSLPT
jgi:CBS domain-containing protein